MKQLTKENLLSAINFIIIFIVVYAFVCFLIVVTTESTCKEFENRPIRYESTLFGTRSFVTSEENADTYKLVCTEYKKPVSFFNINKNIEVIFGK